MGDLQLQRRLAARSPARRAVTQGSSYDQSWLSIVTGALTCPVRPR
jgi:hypothetical protein